MFIKRGYAAAWVLTIVGIAESTYYDRKKKARHPQVQVSRTKSVNKPGRPIPGFSYTTNGKVIPDAQIEEWLMEFIAGEEHIYGYEKLTECLRQQHKLVINDKKGYRLCAKLDILQPQRPRKSKHPRRLALTREITGPNQLWECDIKYAHVHGQRQGRFVFILSYIDVYDKSIVGLHRGPVCEGKHAVQALRQALEIRGLDPLKNGIGPVIRTDNGPQYVSHVFEGACETLGLYHERIPPKCPDKNAHIESFHSQLERDLLLRNEFSSFEESYEAIDRYIEFYNNRRIHRSIFMLSPVNFLKAWHEKKTKPLMVKV